MGNGSKFERGPSGRGEPAPTRRDESLHEGLNGYNITQLIEMLTNPNFSENTAGILEILRTRLNEGGSEWDKAIKKRVQDILRQNGM